MSITGLFTLPLSWHLPCPPVWSMTIRNVIHHPGGRMAHLVHQSIPHPLSTIDHFRGQNNPHGSAHDFPILSGLPAIAVTGCASHPRAPNKRGIFRDRPIENGFVVEFEEFLHKRIAMLFEIVAVNQR